MSAGASTPSSISKASAIWLRAFSSVSSIVEAFRAESEGFPETARLGTSLERSSGWVALYSQIFDCMVAPYACLKRGRERFNPQKLGPTFGLWNVRLNPPKRLVMRNPKLRPSTLRSWRLDPVLP